MNEYYSNTAQAFQEIKRIIMAMGNGQWAILALSFVIVNSSFHEFCGDYIMNILTAIRDYWPPKYFCP